MPTKVVMLSRPDCHLCDAARQVLQRVRKDADFEYSEVDVDGDAELKERYGADIPVVFINDREVARHRIESEAFRMALQGVSGT